MTSNKPLVSIVTPSFNKGPYIEDTIQSVHNQSYSNIEHIVIDGGSTDETLTIMKKYEESLTWISEPDHGQSDAINKGWKMARGDIIAYLNADDTYLPDAVEIIVEFFNAHPEVGVVFGDGIMTDETGKFLEQGRASEFSLRDLVYCKDNILQPAVFLRRSVYERIGGIDEHLHLAMDLDYWIRAGLLFKIVHIPHTLAMAKVYGDAKSVSLMHKYVKDYERILGKVFADPHLPPELAAEKKAIYNYVYTKGGLDCIHLKKPLCGIKYLMKAFFQNPRRCTKNCMELIITFVNK